jgi:EAL domain-containing protein (putative c-di-GMP-specific phosphodiesterase class I)
MIPIGDWVLAVAAAQAGTWHRTFGDEAPDMWINISGQQLGNRHLNETMEQVLANAGLPPAKLGLEVTERQLIGQAETVRAELIELRDLGVRLAVDDFGTGFASLDYLRRFPFDEIKIDQSFVRGLGTDRTDTAVTSSIIALGRSLELVVVAEGVETTDQYVRLRELSCDLAQGFLMQRPAPSDVIDLLLTETTNAHSFAL